MALTVQRTRNEWKGGQDVTNAVPNKIGPMLRLRKEMKAYPYTLSQLAAAADVSRNTVWNLRQGVYWPKLDTAYKIARALNTTVYEIWEEAKIMSFLEELSKAEQAKIMEQFKSEI